MTFNVWATPREVVNYMQKERTEEIGKLIQVGEYDLYLLTEVWSDNYYNIIKRYMPNGYHITKFKELAAKGCQAGMDPNEDRDLYRMEGCSGLLIISRYPIEEAPGVNGKFVEYLVHGEDPHEIPGGGYEMTGEKHATKGWGVIRIKPKIKYGDVTIDVFVTHTCADPGVGDPTNAYYQITRREKQIEQLISEGVLKSTADIIILGGDLNVPKPSDMFVEGYIHRKDKDKWEKEKSYNIIKKAMKNSMVDEHGDSWMERRNGIGTKQYATFNNPRNTHKDRYHAL